VCRMGMDSTINHICIHMSDSHYLGPPQVRQHPRFLLVRRQGLHLARVRQPVVEDLRSSPAHRVRQPRRLGAARSRLPPRMRLLRWQCVGARVQRQQLDAPGLPGVRQRRQQRELGARRGSGPGDEREREPGWGGEEARHRWQRLSGQAVGVLVGDGVQ
jgi:hypothetical protein